MTYVEIICQHINKTNRPLKAKEIISRTLILKMGSKDGTIRTVLNQMVENGALVMVKFPGTRNFYCKPEWVRDGKLLINFDPYFGKKKANEI